MADDSDLREIPKAAKFEPIECRLYSDALADVLCWFNGFCAAKPDAPMPPGLDTLRTLNIKLKDHF